MTKMKYEILKEVRKKKSTNQKRNEKWERKSKSRL